MTISKKILNIGLLIGLLFTHSFAHAEENLNQGENLVEKQVLPNQSITNTEFFPVLEEKIKSPIVQLVQPPSAEWEISPLETFGVQWMIRGKEALSWALNVKTSSNHNPAIEATHNKVLSIVNGLFIIGLLAIAAMWMFSLLIPRKQLKKVMLIYAGAVIFVNFALPFNQLLVDSTQVLQRTLLTGPSGNIVIGDLIQTPNYTESVVYENRPKELAQGKSLNHHIQWSQLEEGPEQDLTFATVHSGEKTLMGSILQGDEIGQMQLNIPESENESLKINPEQTLNFKQTVENKSVSENQVFAFVVMMATGGAYFSMALVLVLRLVMLWALLILSPALLLLAIFNSTRGWFLQWVSVYGRWLMIGPLLALGLSVVVNVWQLAGSPVEVNPFSEQSFIKEPVSTLAFYLPGSKEPNTLANTSQVMDYLLFLFMLYVPVFFAFALTHQKAVYAIGHWIKSYGGVLKKPTPIFVPASKTDVKETEIMPGKQHGFIERLQETVSHKVKQFTQAAMPVKSKQEAIQEEKTKFQKTLMAALPLSDLMHQIKVDHVQKGNESVMENKAVLEKLAFPERSIQNQEHQQLISLRQEIQKRAEQGHEDAKQVWANIQAVASQAPVFSDHHEKAHADSEWDFHQQPEDQKIVEPNPPQHSQELKIAPIILEKETLNKSGPEQANVKKEDGVLLEKKRPESEEKERIKKAFKKQKPQENKKEGEKQEEEKKDQETEKDKDDLIQNKKNDV